MAREIKKKIQTISCTQAARKSCPEKMAEIEYHNATNFQE